MESCNDTVQQLMTLNQQICYACDQVMVINSQIKDLEIRYDRAADEKRKSFRYSLRLRLATLEGTRTMYLEYAKHKATHLDAIEAEITNYYGVQ
jgi:hypothetical protein